MRRTSKEKREKHRVRHSDMSGEHRSELRHRKEAQEEEDVEHERRMRKTKRAR